MIQLLKEDSKAPELNIPDQNGNNVTLKQFTNKIVILYFYPKDDTPGCTIEAKDFTNLKNEFKKLNTVIIGISNDDIDSHNKFINKCSLDITLLSDTTKKIVSDYKVYKEKSMFGKKFMGIERTTFVIKNGIITKIFPKVNPNGHAKEVLNFVKEIQK